MLTQQQENALAKVKDKPLGFAVQATCCAGDSDAAKKILDVYNALSVITLTPEIAKYLEDNDPKALEQAKAALAD